MGSPLRLTNGFTQDLVTQPLGLIGQPNPFFYATWADDFMAYDVANYTATINANGTIASAAGNGGRVLFTTNSSTPLAADINELQTVVANIAMSAGLKTAFLTRMQAATNAPVFQLGLEQKTTTPATIVNGMLATRVTSGTGWLFKVVVGSSITGSVTVPDTLSGYTTASDMDIGMVYNGRGDVLCFMGVGLVGQVLNQNTETLCPIARFTPTSLPSVNLCPTLAMQSGTTASVTANFDFLYAAQER